MTLSAADRAALLARANGLRSEVSTLKTERDAAVNEASASIDDGKLLAEVLRLERERDAALASRDVARGTVEDAMEAMLDAAEKFEVEVLPAENVNPAPLLDAVVLDDTKPGEEG